MTSRNWDKSPETEKDSKFHDLRDSGYRGPIDQDGNNLEDVNAWADEQLGR
ncbi:hypothetical protein GCM10010464_35910 [Pseudonocardia yunnanensis]|uniref:Uncharacterized protein n=1 Tax=Pseudonocardia yunnanensis TaxID=58107 RepID=A0ABW4EPY4_9PSEU